MIGNKDLISNIHIMNLFFYFVLLLISSFTNQEFAIGVGLGGAITVLNFYFIKSILGKLLNEENANFNLNLFIYFIKLGVLLILLYLCIKYVQMNMLAFVFGLSILIVSIFATYLTEMFRKKA